MVNQASYYWVDDWTCNEGIFSLFIAFFCLSLQQQFFQGNWICISLATWPLSRCNKCIILLLKLQQILKRVFLRCCCLSYSLLSSSLMHWVCFVDLRYLSCADFSEFKGGVPAVYSWDCLKKTLFALLVQSNWHVLRTISSLIKSLAYYPLLKCSKCGVTLYFRSHMLL